AHTVQTNIIPSRTSHPTLYPPSVTPLTLFPSLSSYRSDHYHTFHSRGWSSGATSALSFYILGLTITSSGGSTFHIEPQPGNILMYGTLMRSC
ncbi:hypothetical protein M422DRAFT_30783, partial [Sphaerobolus stellatus SS14]